MKCQLKGSVREKWKGLFNLTSICCVCMEKIVKNDLTWRTYCPYKFRKLQYTTLIVKNQFNFKQIIQILQPIVIDYFLRIRISLIFHNIFANTLFKWSFELNSLLLWLVSQPLFLMMQCNLIFTLVMYYSATIIQTTGISSSQATVIWITAAVSAVNVISTLPGKLIGNVNHILN